MPTGPLITSDGKAVRVVHLVAELAPFARSGGLGEAVNSLARFQAASGQWTAIVMPLSWSISNGTGAGVIAHAVLMTVAGRRVPILVWCVAAAFAAYFVLS